MKRKVVSWWTDECSIVFKERNKALRILRRTHNFQNLNIRKCKQGLGKLYKMQKDKAGRCVCNKIGKSTPVGEVWGMIKSIRGSRREWKYPVMKVVEKVAVSDEEK